MELNMDTTALPPLDIFQRYTLEEAARYLRQSRVTTHNDIKQGKLEVIKEGRRRYVPGSSIAARSAAPAAQ
jgi:excisionase family DNA binding protein